MSESIADAEAELRFVRQMSLLSRSILEPNGRRVYDIVIEGVGPFTQLFQVIHPANAYLVWSAITDLVGAPGGPHSDAACETLARAAATDWLSLEPHTPETTDAYFVRWLARTGNS